MLRAASCTKCQGSCGDCGFLADTTGFLNVLAGLREPEPGQPGPAAFETALSDSFTLERFIINDDNLNVGQTIDKYTGYLAQLQLLMNFEKAVNCPDSCKATLKTKVATALGCLNSLKGKYKLSCDSEPSIRRSLMILRFGRRCYLRGLLCL